MRIRAVIAPLALAAGILAAAGAIAAGEAPPAGAASAAVVPPGASAESSVEASATTRVRKNAPSVQKAMQDELARSMTELHLGDEARPYYLAYTISDVEQATATATLGAVTAAHAHRGRMLRTDIRVGEPLFDNTNFEGGARVEPLPIDDDYAALRRELWLRTDEAYKAGLETLARKRAAAAGQAAAEEDESVADFSKEPPSTLAIPFPEGAPDPEQLRETVRRLSAVLADYPELHSSQVSGTFAIVRRRLATSEGTWVDDYKRTVKLDVVADTQAPDGMKLRSYVPFTALEPSGLPPLPEMERAVRAMAKELVAMRSAPIASSGAGAVLFEGLAAAQLAKMLIADQIAGTPPPKTASAGSDDGGQQSALATKLGQRVATPILEVVDDPLLGNGPGRTPLFGSYRIDDEGVPAVHVPLIQRGVLKSLLMSRTPRKEIAHSNGHARAPRFSGPRAHVGTLILSGTRTLGRQALLGELGKIAKGGGITTYVVRLLDDGSLPGGDLDDLSALFSFGTAAHGPPPIHPLVVYRVANGKETLVRGITLENLMIRSLKDVSAIGGEPFVYNYLDGGGGFSGIPSTIVAPALLVSDVDIRRRTGRNRKPPAYVSPLALPSGRQ